MSSFLELGWSGRVILYLDVLIRMEVAANSVFAVIAKTPGYLCTPTYSKVRKMSDMFQLKRGIYELSSDIAKLCAEILEIKTEDA